MSATPLPVLPPVRPPRVVRLELSLKSLFTVMGLLAGVWLLGHALPVLLVLVAALMLVGALYPAVAGLERRGVWRGLAVVVVFAGGALLSAALFMLTAPTVLAQVKSVAELLDKYGVDVLVIRREAIGRVEAAHLSDRPLAARSA